MLHKKTHRTAVRPVPVIVLALAAWLSSAAPASAQECPAEGCPPDFGAPQDPQQTVPTTAPATGTVPTTVPTTGPTTDPTAVGVPSSSTALASPSTVSPGASVTIQGAGFGPDQTLQMTFTDSSPVALGSTQSDATGSYSATVTIPSTATVGAHEITVSGPDAQGGTHESVAAITVGLAQTGVMTNIMVLVGVTALAAGVHLVLKSQWSPPVSTAGFALSRRRTSRRS